jgi:hypothetical protein
VSDINLVSMQPEGSDIDRSQLSSEDAGRACPYCHQALTEDRALAVCGECGAAHHADCWRENGGCAVVACAGGPKAAAGARGPSGSAPTEPAPSERVGYEMSPATLTDSLPPSMPSARGVWRTPSLGLAIAVLAIAVAGAGVAIALAISGGKSHQVAVPTQVVTAPMGAGTTAPTQGGTETAPTGTTAGGEGSLPNVSTTQMESDIQHMLLEWHEDVVHGNYHAAWELLSHRKQEQANSESGYATWAKNQATLRPYLNPANLKVSVQSTEPSEGVTQVDVTGMTWSKPGASCKEWSGITWVKYEEGAWRYDPGYSTTPQREHEWKSRFSELLGGRC